MPRKQIYLAFPGLTKGNAIPGSCLGQPAAGLVLMDFTRFKFKNIDMFFAQIKKLLNILRLNDVPFFEGGSFKSILNDLCDIVVKNLADGIFYFYNLRANGYSPRTIMNK
ncbi:hypothetical protein P378_04210 [Desulforamulus profundi]|uniref:Uncharacterized protein n=1 Tax=Desulforamulus profundi TaxID=1383067 RepID=A0A2C6MDK3_9FIRM|nr:hypothetical protein P378_04210 [Desulforamulus profundi]